MSGSFDFTVVGAAGFIGSHVFRNLRNQGYDCFAPDKDDASLFSRPLGHLIYCAGLSADFRTRPYDTIDAHVCFVSRILQRCDFTSLTYLSSTRVYIRSHATNESAALEVEPLVADDLFNLSKLAGESICLQSGRQNVRVARLSNVLGEDFGSDNFVFSLIRDAASSGEIVLRTTLDSAKDYVHIDDVCEVLTRVASAGKHTIYNVASGQNLTHAQIIEQLGSVFPVEVTVAPNSRRVAFRRSISID